MGQRRTDGRTDGWSWFVIVDNAGSKALWNHNTTSQPVQATPSLSPPPPPPQHKNKGDKVTKFLSIFNYRPICLFLCAFSFPLLLQWFFFSGISYFFTSVGRRRRLVSNVLFCFFFYHFGIDWISWQIMLPKLGENISFFSLNSFRVSFFVVVVVLLLLLLLLSLVVEVKVLGCSFIWVIPMWVYLHCIRILCQLLTTVVRLCVFFSDKDRNEAPFSTRA